MIIINILFSLSYKTQVWIDHPFIFSSILQQEQSGEAMTDQSADNSKWAIRIASLNKERLVQKIRIKFYFTLLTSILPPPFKLAEALLQGAIADVFGIPDDRIKILLTHNFYYEICYWLDNKSWSDKVSGVKSRPAAIFRTARRRSPERSTRMVNRTDSPAERRRSTPSVAIPTFREPHPEDGISKNMRCVKHWEKAARNITVSSEPIPPCLGRKTLSDGCRDRSCPTRRRDILENIPGL